MQARPIGIIGCGNISDAYLRGAARSRLITVKAVADLNPDAAAAKAETYGTQAVSIDRLLQDEDIEIVLNITVPLAHAEVSHAVIDAGKHVYSEKPLAVTYQQGRSLIDAAAARNLRVGCAPDTFLGAGHQACREAIDQGRIGKVVGAAASFLSHGMEHWHPNPTFFFKPGGGPVLDMTPYHLTALINMIGPATRVTSLTSRGSDTRTVTAEGPMTGKQIEVEIPTFVNGLIAFANGANVTLTTTWDVWKSERQHIEVYGSEGSLLVPDPNFFGGTPLFSKRKGDWREIDPDAFAYGTANRKNGKGDEVADHRIIGLLDMAASLETNRPHRANGETALHVLEIMEALTRSSEEGRHIDIQTQPPRPAPLPKGNDETIFLQT